MGAFSVDLFSFYFFDTELLLRSSVVVFIMPFNWFYRALRLE